MGFLFWIKERIGNSFPKVSGHLSRNRELFEQFPKPSPALRGRLSQRESGGQTLNTNNLKTATHCSELWFCLTDDRLHPRSFELTNL
jgi:hypothetical protein